jgi:hypothetical protein
MHIRDWKISFVVKNFPIHAPLVENKCNGFSGSLFVLVKISPTIVACSVFNCFHVVECYVVQCGCFTI